MHAQPVFRDSRAAGAPKPTAMKELKLAAGRLALLTGLTAAGPALAQSAPVHTYTDVGVAVSDTACPQTASCTSARSIERINFGGGPRDNTSERVSYRNGVLESEVYSSGASLRTDLARSSSLATARAYADLQTGKIGVFASSKADGFASARASMEEQLVFTVAGANAGTITSISAIARIHATSVSLLLADYQLCSVEINRCQINDGYGFDARFTGQLSALFPNIRPRPYGMKSFTSTLEGDTLTVSWSFDLVGESTALRFIATLAGDGNRGTTTDAINTASISFVLPDNVKLGSGSGQFLRGPAVPEPSAWAMLIGGFGLMGAAMRRRQRMTVTYA